MVILQEFRGRCRGELADGVNLMFRAFSEMVVGSLEEFLRDCGLEGNVEADWG